MKLIVVTAALVAASLFVGCTTYVRPTPPPARVEVRPARPGAHALWVPGHWQWKNRRTGYVWVPGHWKVRRAY